MLIISFLSHLLPSLKFTIIFFNTNAFALSSLFLFISVQKGIFPPQNVTVKATTSTSLTVKWLPVSSSSHNAYSYRVTWAVNNARASVSVATSSYNIRGLKPFTTYEIRVAAVDGNQIGPFSNAVWVQTLEGGKLFILVVQ